VKNERGIGMNLDEDRVNMMVTAMGRAIMELSLADLPITQEASSKSWSSTGRKWET
jgi:hypothetical protein